MLKAEALEKRWATLAEALGIQEEHYGFYDSRFLSPIMRKLDDMLTVCEPIAFYGGQPKMNSILIAPPNC